MIERLVQFKICLHHHVRSAKISVWDENQLVRAIETGNVTKNATYLVTVDGADSCVVSAVYTAARVEFRVENCDIIKELKNSNLKKLAYKF